MATAAPSGPGYHQTEFENHQPAGPVDAIVARTSLGRLPDSGEPGWLHNHRQRWIESGQPWRTYLDDWAGQEGLHSGPVIIQALQARFQTRLLTSAPHFFSDLYPTAEADERAAADSGAIQATGIRYVATMPADRLSSH